MVAFARSLGLIRRKAKFIAIDGEHYTEIIKESGNVTFVKLNMSNVETGKFKVRRLKSKIQNPKTKNQNRPSYVVLNTGSPHLVLFVDNATGIDLMADGRKLRYDPQFAPDGVNVDFVQVLEDGSLFVRTYERGVENETLSCGTGVTAAAIAFAVTNRRSLPLPQPLPKKGGEFSYQIISHCIKTLGGKLTVSFRQKDTRFSDIWLEGPAEFVFEGKI